ncbi:MAG TPA: T9SS type A sorting domain-containing protein, partial [Chitinophagaceae bacterium]|nr:T9SS type A sorting domain-containing protein [Chitinophagaceae bacterium]
INAPASSRLFIFPSPNDGRFSVSYYNAGGNNTQRQIMIYDAKGAAVYSRKFSIAGPYTLLNIDLRQANTGIYFVVVGDAQGKKLAEGKVHVR